LKKIISVIYALILTAFCFTGAIAASFSVEYEGMTIKADYPTTLDCYIIATEKSSDSESDSAESEVWSTRIYSYDFLPGVDIDGQSVKLISLTIEGALLIAVDERGVIYKLNAKTGMLISTDDTAYSEPEYSITSSEKSDGDKTVIRVVIAFAILSALLVFVAARKPKEKPADGENANEKGRKKRTK